MYTTQKHFYSQEKIRKIEEDHKGTIERLRREIHNLEKDRQKQVCEDKQHSKGSPPLKLKLVQEIPRLRAEERQAGEVTCESNAFYRLILISSGHMERVVLKIPR